MRAHSLPVAARPATPEVPPARPVLVASAVLLIAFGGVFAAPRAAAQEPEGGRTPVGAVLPLPSDGELGELLEILHARDGISLAPIETVGVALHDVERALAESAPGVQGPVGAESEAGGAWLAAARAASAPGVDVVGGGRWGDALLDPGAGALVGAHARARVSGRFGVSAVVEAGGWDVYAGVRELLGTARLGPVVFSAGRSRPRLGPGVDDLIVPGTHSLDGLGIASATPFRLPGPFARIGEISASASVYPMDRVGNTDDPWYGIVALSLDPTSWLRVGLNRSSVFGGEGLPGITAERVLRMLAGFHSTNQGEFEDQFAELFLRLRVVAAGQPVVLYGAFAVNDSEGAYRDDPGAQAGLVVPVAPTGWLGALRYEYVSFGPGAKLCFWCDEGRSRSWFTHYVLGRHETEGLPMGSTLGGYGARHLLRWKGWAPGERWSFEAEAFTEDRDAGNLLESRWPGARTGARVGGTLRPWADLRVEARVGYASADGGTYGDSGEGTLELRAIWSAFPFEGTAAGGP